MKAIDEQQLDAYLSEREKRLYGRLLLNRFFQGYVTAINYSLTPFQVQVQRIGESTTDNAWYAVYAPGYWPLVGDRVELVWTEDLIAVVLAPINSVSSSSLQAGELYGTGQGIGATPSSSRFLSQEGSFAGTTDGLAHLTITLPKAFPNGLLNVLVSPGDNGSGLTQLQLQYASCNTTTIVMWCGTSSGTSIIGGALRVNYRVVGW